jgi:hypothetical protein
MQYPNIAQPQYGFAPTMPMMGNGGSVADAQSVQSKGRGRDTMLVHMTPKEVGGLQALAMQHGGSLTINPQTGLPEAEFLEAILPTLLGIGGSFIGIPPHVTAAIVGGIQTARTGDLGQGLLAGLGAYGGASMGAGASSAGAAGGAGGAAPTAGLEFATTPAELAAATGGEAAATAAVPSATTGATAASAVTDPTQQALLKAGLTDAQVAANTGPLATAPISQAAAAPPVDVFGNPLGVDEMAAQGAGAGSSTSILAPPSATPPPATFSSRAADAARGVGNIFTEPDGFDKFVGEAANPKTGAPATGLGGGTAAITKAGMAVAPALLATPEYKPPEEKEKTKYEGPYTPSERGVSYPGVDDRRRTSEFTYFAPSNPVPFNVGGLASLARGGSVPTLENGGFVLTKKAVDGLGKGNNEKGQANAQRGLGAIPIRGAGAKRGPKAGVDDKIKTTIDGKRPALVSNGEAYIPKKQVAKKGGAKAFYALMKQAEKAADKRRRA